jgi:hypothetical protein
MAVLKKIVPKEEKTGVKTVPKKKDAVMPVNVALPDEISQPLSDISQLSIVIYGQTGIGKSSLCRHFGKPFYFRFEPSSKWLQLYQTPVLTHWNIALSYLRAAENNLKGYTTFVLDTAGPCYDRCMEGVCERLNISHPGKVKDYGASWKEVQKEYHQFHSRIAALGVGLIIIAHDTTEDFDTMDGKNRNMIVPHFSGWCMDFYKRWVDVIGYYFYLNDERYLLIRGTDLVMAKCNTEDHFLTKDGRRIVCIPMGRSSEESYQNFMAAFNNQQENSYEEILKKSGYVAGYQNSMKSVVKKAVTTEKKIMLKKTA